MLPVNLTQPSSQSPIGIFDSGVGGLSVLRHIREELPQESLCYFADAGFLPYGDKTESELMERALFAAQCLLSQGVKAIVVACNTATAAAIAMLRSHYPELILVGVEPGLKPGASLTKTGCVGVIATTSTLGSKKYQALSGQIQQASQVRFIQQACPGLADRIEHGELNTANTLQLLDGFLQPILQSPADVLVLGCTHYTFVIDSIRQIAKKANRDDIQIVDTGLAIARQLQRLLSQRQLLNLKSPELPIMCTTTGEAGQLEFAFNQLLKLSPDHVSVQEIGCKLPLT